ncbi:hypothetical protein GCM10027416_31180 [Okibacterium endophyticum]
MQLVKLTIDKQSYTLSSDVDLDRLQAQLVSAARNGAGMVDIPVVGARKMTALITPAIPVTVVSTTVTDEVDDEPDPDVLHSYNYDELY